LRMKGKLIRQFKFAPPLRPTPPLP
jgi:hypothetical protein